MYIQKREMKRTLNQVFCLVVSSLSIFAAIIALYIYSGQVQAQGYDTEEATAPAPYCDPISKGESVCD